MRSTSSLRASSWAGRLCNWFSQGGKSSKKSASFRPQITVLEDRCLMSGVASFVDQDGDFCKVTLTGPGTLAVTLDDADGDGKGSIAQISLDGSDAVKSSLQVVVTKKGDGLVDIAGIQASVGLKSIMAKSSDLVDGGIKVEGYLGSLTLHGVLGADIIAGGLGTLAVATDCVGDVFLDDGGDVRLMDLGSATIGGNLEGTWEIAGPVQKITVNKTVSGWALQASSLQNLKVLGNFQGFISLGSSDEPSGDFQIQPVFRTIAANSSVVLSSVTILGAVQFSTFQVTGKINAFQTGSFASSEVTVDGTGVSSGIGSFTVKGPFASSYVTASNIGSVILAEVVRDNDGIPFGITAMESIGTIRIQKPFLTFSNVLPPHQQMGDFYVICKALEAVKADILDVELNMPWSSVYDSFVGRRDGWIQDVQNAGSAKQLARLVEELEYETRPEALKDTWWSRYPSWLGELRRASTPAAVDALLKEFQKNLK